MTLQIVKLDRLRRGSYTPHILKFLDVLNRKYSYTSFYKKEGWKRQILEQK